MNYFKHFKGGIQDKKDRNVEIREGEYDTGRSSDDYFADIKKVYDFKIIALDDDEINLKVLENFMKMEKLSIDTLTSPHDFLDKISRNRYDLVLLDIMMPEMSGIEVCKKIRESYSPVELPVLMLTAKNKTEDVTEGFQNGANDYVVKPFEREELVCRIKNLLTMKYSVETAIKNNIILEEEKHKSTIKDRLGKFEMMVTAACAEKKRENGTVLILSILLLLLKDTCKKIYFYKYNEKYKMITLENSISVSDFDTLEKLYSNNFMMNFDEIYKITETANNEDLIKTTAVLEMFEKSVYQKVSVWDKNISMGEGEEGRKTLSIPIIYGTNIYGAAFADIEKEPDEERLFFINVVAGYLAVYFERHKIEKEKMDAEKTKDYRCIKCNRKLFAYKNELSFMEIKCPKCDTINKIE